MLEGEEGCSGYDDDGGSDGDAAEEAEQSAGTTSTIR
jgi:hypothetical protein